MNNNSEKSTMMGIPTVVTSDLDSNMSQTHHPGLSAIANSTIEETAAMHTQLIAESAYFAAEKRNFCNGDPIQDWLLAERELSDSATRQ